MLFNSLEYFLFLPAVWLGALALRGRWRQLWLIAASLVFYMAWSVPFVTLLLACAFLNWALALRIEATRGHAAARRWLTLAIALDLGVLATFKYWNFFLGSLIETASWLGVSQSVLPSIPWSGWILPLGISFYTFQAMAYTIDVYRGHFRARRRAFDVLLFLAFFPQLVAGPIERPAHLLPQLEAEPRFSWDDLREGSARILGGLVKKVWIADNVARLVDPVYAAPEAHSGLALLLATYAFALQIYCDFSGYSDIAIGTARLFGVRMVENFDSPYLARSLQEFWRRWHISLSGWLRDYLYIPLGGNRLGVRRAAVNLLVTMLLGGLWHGASWNFVVWGGLHGVWLAVERLVTRRPGWNPADRRTSPRAIVQTLLTFHGVCLGWVFFRAASFGDAGHVLGGIARGASGRFYAPFDLAWIFGVALLGCGYFALERMTRAQPLARAAVAVAGLLGIVLFGASSSEFIYFVF